ncbi:unnamed protein product [Pieris macdunnoughi]|uniref:Uncharacterized protein n=1 Tax=Pieris macdunnoughi TaxID=345717 RepID=A0A821XRT7_9NEOP|nr:unnamed protein product [Pieris macdunnoughi]
MDRKISARSLFLVQSVLDKNEEKNVVESQNNQSFRNACNDLFDQPSTSGVIGDSCPAPTEISSINKDIFVEEGKENIPCQQFTNDDILCCDDVSMENKCCSNEPILCELVSVYWSTSS